MVSMFSRPDAWRSVANRLPEDAKVVSVEDDSYGREIAIWITSSVFQESDPVDLPAVEFKAFPMVATYVEKKYMDYHV